MRTVQRQVMLPKYYVNIYGTELFDPQCVSAFLHVFFAKAVLKLWLQG